MVPQMLKLGHCFSVFSHVRIAQYFASKNRMPFPGPVSRMYNYVLNLKNFLILFAYVIKNV